MRATLMALSLACSTATAQTPWPAIEAPQGARSVVVAPDVVLNGQRSRIVQVDSAADVDALAEHYRNRFGARRVDNRLGDAQIVAMRDGDFFHTVQVRRLSAAGGAQATIITTAIAPTPSRSAALKDTQSWLPHGSVMQQTMEATDQGVRSITVSVSNTHSVQRNRDLLLQAMAQRGLRLVRESKSDPTAGMGRESVVMWLAARDENVVATVSDAGERRAVSIIRSKEPAP
jgi:hypothetical protein